MICKKCRYEWKTKSNKIYVSCPNCHYNNKRELTPKQMIKNFTGIKDDMP